MAGLAKPEMFFVYFYNRPFLEGCASDPEITGSTDQREVTFKRELPLCFTDFFMKNKLGYYQDDNSYHNPGIDKNQQILLAIITFDLCAK